MQGRGPSMAVSDLPVRGLPAQLTSFVGRRRELRDLAGLLTSRRLITLTGVGGVGKTRLALQVAERVRRGFAGAVGFVDLAAAADTAELPSLVQAALGLRGRQAGSPAEVLAAGIGQRRVLLVLDNCEHVALACGELVEELLAVCGSLVVLAISREPLGVAGENCQRVDPLPATEAVQLLCERTARDAPGAMDLHSHLPQEQAQRPGHIPGATNTPWARAVNPDTGEFLPEDQLRALYAGQGIDPGGGVVAYCRIGERSAHTWFVLHELLGYPRVRNYDGSWTEWGSMVGVPIER